MRTRYVFSTLLAMAVSLMAMEAQAQVGVGRWQPVDNKGGAAFYIDLSSIRGAGSKGAYTFDTGLVKDDRSYTRTTWAISCARRSMNTERRTKYAASGRLESDSIERGSTSTASPGDSFDALAKAVCDGDRSPSAYNGSLSALAAGVISGRAQAEVDQRRVQTDNLAALAAATGSRAPPGTPPVNQAGLSNDKRWTFGAESQDDDSYFEVLGGGATSAISIMVLELAPRSSDWAVATLKAEVDCKSVSERYVTGKTFYDRFGRAISGANYPNTWFTPARGSDSHEFIVKVCKVASGRLSARKYGAAEAVAFAAAEKPVREPPVLYAQYNDPAYPPKCLVQRSASDTDLEWQGAPDSLANPERQVGVTTGYNLTFRNSCAGPVAFYVRKGEGHFSSGYRAVETITPNETQRWYCEANRGTNMLGDVVSGGIKHCRRAQ